jgi:RNA polymerase sigma factor (sigma-70 family)
MNETDLDLLSRYTRQHAEDAFAELVRRHLNLVYSAALRQVRSPQLAEEVAQSTFTDLARNTHRLTPDTILTAWLYQVTSRSAIDVVRREASRQLRERIATEMNALNASDADWSHIEPLLDEAMDTLQMAMNLGQDCSELGGGTIIGQLVGLAIERNALVAMDPNSPYGDAGQTVQDQITAIDQQKAEVKQLYTQFTELQPTMSDEDWANYTDRFKSFGETAAAHWVVSKYGRQ